MSKKRQKTKSKTLIMTLPSKIRIKDIAQMAGVSTGTVDRVLHGRPNVALKSKEKVEKVLQEINYQPNRVASALARTKPVHLIALIPQYAKGNYWQDVVKGMQLAEKEFIDFKVTLTLLTYDQFNYYSFEQRTQEIVHLHPDGVIIAPVENNYTQTLIQQLTQENIPLVYIDANYHTHSPLAFYGQNPQKSGEFAARIVMMLNPQNNPIVVFKKIYEGMTGTTQQERREIGFLNYMQKHHPKCSILKLELPAKRPEEDEAMLHSFFKKHPQAKAGAIFNSNAFIVASYLKKYQENNFHLLGYDLLDQNVKYLREGYIDFLIAQDPDKQGFHAIETLCNYLLFHIKPEKIHYMPIHLISTETIEEFV